MNRAWRRSAVLAAGLLACAPAFGAGFDLAGGPSITSGQRITGAAFASAFGESPADGRGHLDPIFTIGRIDARSTTRDDLDHVVLLAAGGVRFVTAGGRWFLGEQLAAAGTRTVALSSRFEFMTSAGWQDGIFIVMLRHVSNAHVLGDGKNLGETMLLAGVRW